MPDGLSFESQKNTNFSRFSGNTRNFYIYIEPNWLAFDSEGQETFRTPATIEFSKISGRITFCDIDTEILIYRRPKDIGWSIDYNDSKGTRQHFGKGFRTDEDAFECFVSKHCADLAKL